MLFCTYLHACTCVCWSGRQVAVHAGMLFDTAILSPILTLYLSLPTYVSLLSPPSHLLPSHLSFSHLFSLGLSLNRDCSLSLPLFLSLSLSLSLCLVKIERKAGQPKLAWTRDEQIVKQLGKLFDRQPLKSEGNMRAEIGMAIWRTVCKSCVDKSAYEQEENGRIRCRAWQASLMELVGGK